MNLLCLLLFIVCIWDSPLLISVQSLEAEGIIRGENDWHNDFKYQVSIQVKKNRTGLYEHGCGGAIISNWYILTAAHCFVSKNDSILDLSNDHVRILAGTNQQNLGGIYRFVDKVYIYKKYSHKNHFYEGDIAVIKLKSKLDVTNDGRLEKIRAPKKSSYNAYVNKIATVSGFGISKFKYDFNENGTWTELPVLPNIRQYLQVRIVSKEMCTPSDSIICTLNEEPYRLNKIGICDGDSGGPLVYNGTIIGIVSRAAKDCDMRIKTAKFTRVAYYLDFIRRAVKEISDKSDMLILHS